MEAKYKKLVKNTVIFSIGEFANKILNFLIVPLYTYVLTTEEYGRIDLFTTSISFLIPIMTLQVQEALIRFLLGKEIDQETATSNCWLVYLLGAIFAVALFPGYLLFFESTHLAVIFTVLVLTNAFNSIFTHYLRAIGKTIEYTAKSVFGTSVHLFLNVLFLLILRWGMNGYLYAMLISQLFGVSYLLIVGKLRPLLNFKHVNRQMLSSMLRFSIPLIPNTLMWWIMSAGDKYIINYFLGDSANGLYSLALKIPTIISLFYSFFYQAWQMSAIEENSSEGRRNFYEQVYKTTNAFLILLVSGIVLFVKPLYVLVMSDKFAPAWMYVPFLSLGMAFSCQASFFGVVYTTSKKTKKVFTTTAFGAALNLLLNFLIIRLLGLQGVAIATCLGYVGVACIRAFDTRREIRLSFDLKRLMPSMIIVVFQIMITLHTDAMLSWIGAVCVAIQMIIYRQELLKILFVVKKKLLQKR